LAFAISIRLIVFLQSLIVWIVRELSRVFAVSSGSGRRSRAADGPSDEELVRAFTNDAGRPQERNRAFDALVRRHQHLVFSLCARILGDYDEASDCAQEVFIKIYHNLGAFKMEASLTTWLYRIAVNTCRNRMASAQYRARQRSVNLDAGDDDSADGPPRELGDDSFAPENLVMRREDARAIQRAINTLPEAQRLLIVLRDVDGKSYSDISAITGIKEGTVKSGLARARERLREILREAFDDV